MEEKEWGRPQPLRLQLQIPLQTPLLHQSRLPILLRFPIQFLPIQFPLLCCICHQK